MYKLYNVDDKSLFFSKDRMAKVLGINPGVLLYYVAEGCPQEKNGRFYSPRVIHWLLSRKTS